MDSEDLLYLLYTSGTTAKPKGIMHTTAGYLVGTSATHRLIFDIKPDDVYWCMADIGWVTGHSYIVYGPLANGARPGSSTRAARLPRQGPMGPIVDRYHATILYTAPTAIRALMKYGRDVFAADDLSSLRLLGSVGEPINPEAWAWYWKYIGGERCPVVDTWWQTETGMILITPLPGITTTKPGSATFPFPGIEADVVDEAGNSVPLGGGGYLVLERPWPAMLRGIYGDHDRYVETYWTRYPGPLLRRRRLQARRRGLLLAPRPRRRRDEHLRPPHLHDRGGVGARLPPRRRRGRGRRPHRPDHRPGDLLLRHPARTATKPTESSRPRCASTSPR